MKNRISHFFSKEGDDFKNEELLKIKTDAKNVIDTCENFVVFGIKDNHAIGVSYTKGLDVVLKLLVIIQEFNGHLIVQIKKLMLGGEEL